MVKLMYDAPRAASTPPLTGTGTETILKGHYIRFVYEKGNGIPGAPLCFPRDIRFIIFFA